MTSKSIPKIFTYLGFIIFLTTLLFANPFLRTDIWPPVGQKWPLIATFYLSLGFFIWGATTLWRSEDPKRNENRQEITAKNKMIFRQGLWLAVVIVALLFLQSLRALTWWDALIVVGAVSLAEWFCLLE